MEAEPGAGLLGNVKCTFRGLETWEATPARSRIGAKFLHAFLVLEDGSSVSPRVARVPLPANEADRPSCSSRVVSGVPIRECFAR